MTHEYKGTFISAPPIILITTWMLVFMSEAFAHPGDLDKQGGHSNRTTGEYHNHRAVDPPPHMTVGSSYVESHRSVLVGRYFRKANGSGVLDWNGIRVDRDVSDSLRFTVLARDGHKCIICGSTYDLELDRRSGK